MPGDLQTRIYISARTEALALGLQKAEDMTKQTMQRMNKLQATPGGGVGGGGLEFKGGELIGGLAKGVVTIGAIQAGVSTLHAGVAVLKGDWEGVEEIVRRLPAGIGQIVGGVIDLSRELDGSAARSERMAKAAKELADQTARWKIFASASEGASSGTQGVRWQTQHEAADPFGKIQLEREEALRKAAEEFEGLRGKARSAFSGKQMQAALAYDLEQIGYQEQERIAAINEQFDQRRDRETERSAAALKERALKSYDAEQELQERLADLRGRYAVAELESQGETLNAKLQQIENSYRSQIEKATAGEKELLEKLKIEEQVTAQSEDNKRRERERQAERQAERGKEYDMQARAEEQAKARIAQTVSAIRGQSLGAEDAGFLTRGAGTDRSQEIATEQLKVQEETKRILDEMRREQRKRAQYVEVGFNG